MIAQAFGPNGPLSPQEIADAALLARLRRNPDHLSVGEPAPEVHTAEFARGRERGFREGIEAAMKLMGVK